jgi:hypothetical protein
MKKILLLALLLSSLATHLSPLHAQSPRRYAINFESHNGESFNVFIDGEIANRMPQSRVMVNDISDRTHQVVVVLKRPVQKAAVIDILPGEPNIMVNVIYDERNEQLSLYTPACNRPETHHAPAAPARPLSPRGVPEGRGVPPNSQLATPNAQPSTPPSPQQVSNEDLAAMLLRMKGQTFDSDRLALGRVIVASSNLNARQIAALVETLDYSSSQVDLLKYAYPYCIDPKNYSVAIDVLTFSADKKKVSDYIATQQ